MQHEACRQTGARESPFAPIAEYGFLSDAETTALLAPSGNVEWMCLPRIDSPSVFGSMLDRDAGYFRVGPAGVEVPAAPPLHPGHDGAGDHLVDARRLAGRPRHAADGPWHHETDGRTPHRRAPTDYDADHVLLRTLRCVNGQVQVRLDCLPVFDYGRSRGAVGATTAPATTRRRPAARHRPPAHHRHERRLRGAAGHRPYAAQRGRHPLRRALVERARAAALRRGAAPARPGRSTTGSTGWTAAGSPTTRGAATSSAARSRSRA